MKPLKWFLITLAIFIGGFCFWPVTLKPAPTTWFFYDQMGEVLYQESAVTSQQTEHPTFLLESLVMLEDQAFYSHGGVDFKALLRATLQNVRSNEVVSGASTLTMQLAGLEFLPGSQRNWWYKIRQALLALKLEQKLTKSEILNRYLAQVNLGNGAYGFESAARRYFSKDLAQLSIGETATLLAIVQNPSLFNPIAKPERSLQRRNLILSRLKAAEVIDVSAYEYWINTPIKLKPEINNVITAPHFVFWVKARLAFLEGQAPEVHVHTTLDKELYEDSLVILRETIKRNQKERHITNGSLVVLDKNNQVKVMVGSPDFFEDSIDGAVNLATAYRQTGSVLKPFLYSLALDNGFSPAGALTDLKTIFPEGYLPRNFEVNQENGSVRFREALANSYNIAAVDLLNQIGIESFYYFLEQLGLNLRQSPQSLGLSMILGSTESSLLHLTQAYSVFTHQGDLNDLIFINKVADQAGDILYEPPLPVAQKVLSSASAQWGQHVLSDDEARWKNFSRGNSLELPFSSGAKTGTSQGFRDNWVLGFSPLYTVGVWVGNADGTPMVSSSGMQGAGPMWQSVMQRLHRAGGVPGFKYESDRTLTTACRRPGSFDCSETVSVFLTPSEREALNKTTEPVTLKTLEIVYPAEGDTFVAGSDLLIQLRGPNLQGLTYTFNEEVFTGPIFNNLPLGKHSIGVRNLDGELIKVHIEVENL